MATTGQKVSEMQATNNWNGIPSQGMLKTFKEDNEVDIKVTEKRFMRESSNQFVFSTEPLKFNQANLIKLEADNFTQKMKGK